MKFNEKRGITTIIAAMLIVMLMSGTVLAKTQKPKPPQDQPVQNSAEEQQKHGKPGHMQEQEKDRDNSPNKRNYGIQEMEYSKGGNLRIKINNSDKENIQWGKDNRIVVRDSQGRTHNAKIKRVEKNVIELIVANLAFGENYSAEIYGLDRNNRNYKIRGDFWANDRWSYNEKNSSRGIVIQKMWYNGAGKLKIKLYNPNGYNLRWNNDVRVRVRDSEGRSYNAKIRRAGHNTVELTIRGLRYGHRYSISISGVRYDNVGYSVTSSFWTRDNWSYER